MEPDCLFVLYASEVIFYILHLLTGEALTAYAGVVVWKGSKLAFQRVSEQ
jgi:hypothetical protein